MSRRNQARRRRSYTRRQHEVRERRDEHGVDVEWQTRDEDVEWGSDRFDGQQGAESGAPGGLSR